MEDRPLTIGRLAREAGVGVETVRYYQRLALLPTPSAESGFRHYSVELVDRIQFIKRAQTLGFSLQEIASLLQLNDGVDRRSIRKVAAGRLAHIREKIAALQTMESVLSQLLDECKHSPPANACPIIAAFSEDGGRLPE